MVKWIPTGSRVIEFGSGNQKLRSLLDASCIYIGSDFVKRNPDTFLCDLNKRSLPDLGHLAPEVAVLSGVLEYVHDVPHVAEWLFSQIRASVIFSYSCSEGSNSSLLRLRVAIRRADNGWVNNYTEGEIAAIFSKAGFKLKEKDSWDYQRLFFFEKPRAMACE